MTDIFLNGKFIGTCEKGEEFVKKIREKRREGVLPPELNVRYWEKLDTIYIYTEKGRARRPLIVVKNGKSLLTKDYIEKLKKGEIKWSDLIKKGIIEYLDAEEEENAYIALTENELTPEHTHLELTPLIMFGPTSGMVPWPEHNVSSRFLYGQKMLKQGIGLYQANYILDISRADISVLHYPQKPIVRTYANDIVHFDSHPVGQNIVVAVLNWEGYNMDDAIVMNKGSIDRGLFRATYFRPYKTEEIKYPGGLKDKIEIPDKDVARYRSEEAYRLLEDDGIIFPEAVVKEGDVLIGKTSPPRFLASIEELRFGIESRFETSVTVKHEEKGIVDTVIITESEEGNKFVKVRVRDPRIPEIGDKFANRHAQKGVIGMIVPQEDMPFTADGMIPDIIFNPHGIPSRMTVSHLIEMIGGKVGALSGKYIDGTAWSGMDEKELRKMLLELGFREDGAETMYNGITGEEYKARIFVGNMYYMRLRYMAANKLHARSRGPVQLLTRQPTEGKAKEGGLRLGEMEKDTFMGHGAALLLKERFDSDKVTIPVCKNCGMVAIYNRYKKQAYCPVCGEDAPITFIEVSYAFKLFLDELKAMGIYPKLKIGPKG